MRTRRHLIFFFLTFLLAVGTARAADSADSGATAPPQIQALRQRSTGIQSEANSLLKKVKAERERLLELEKQRILEELRKWQDGDILMDGQNYHAQLELALAQAAEYGLDIDQMRRMHDLMKKVILRTDFVKPELSGAGGIADSVGQYAQENVVNQVLKFFDYATGEEERMAEAQRMRVEYYKKCSRFFIQALLERDPQTALDKFRRYLEALQSIQNADTMILVEEAKQIVEVQRLVVDVTAGIPGLGEVWDVAALMTGEDLTGRKLSSAEYGLTAFFTVGIPVLGQVVKRAGPTAKKLYGSVAARFLEATESQRRQMAEIAGATVEEITQFMSTLSRVEGMEEIIDASRSVWRATRAVFVRIKGIIDEMWDVVKRADAAVEETKAIIYEKATEARRLINELPEEMAVKARQMLDDALDAMRRVLDVRALRESILGEFGKLDNILDDIAQRSDFVVTKIQAQFDEIAEGIRSQIKNLPAEDAAEMTQKLEASQARLAGRLDELADVTRANFLRNMDELEAQYQALRAMETGSDEARRAMEELRGLFNQTQNGLKNLRPEDAAELGQKLADFERRMMDDILASTRQLDEAGEELNDLWHAAEAEARERIAHLQRLVDAGDTSSQEFLEAYMALRQDKRALKELTSLTDELRDLRIKLHAFEERMLANVDKEVSEALADALLKGKTSTFLDAEMIEKARRRMAGKLRDELSKRGIDTTGKTFEELLELEGDINITTFKATNKPDAIDKIGMDRDITYQVVVHGVEIDIPAEVAERVYHDRFYRNLHGGQAPPGWEQTRRWGNEQMDHVVTDRLAADAYDIDMDVREFFKDPTKLTRQEMKNITDTMQHKSYEWFERADHQFEAAREATRQGSPATNPFVQEMQKQAMRDMTEGCRQAVKQYRNYTQRIMEARGLDPTIALPSTVRQGMEIFDRLDNRTITYPEAMAALERLGTDPRRVVADFATHFEAMLKFGQD